VTESEKARIDAYVSRRVAEFPPLTERQKELVRRALSAR
jgi:hypothetical protein